MAFLDLDHTLFTADSNQLWMAFLQSQHLISAAEVDRHERFMDDYAKGVLDWRPLGSQWPWTRTSRSRRWPSAGDGQCFPCGRPCEVQHTDELAACP